VLHLSWRELLFGEANRTHETRMIASCQCEVSHLDVRWWPRRQRQNCQLAKNRHL